MDALAQSASNITRDYPVRLLMARALRNDDRFNLLAARTIAWARARKPDFVVGGEDDPYLLRWFVNGGVWRQEPDGKSKWVSKRALGVRSYVHCFKRSDDDRALHDHPARSLSIGLAGAAMEHTIAAGGIHNHAVLGVGDIRYRSARFAHRIELEPGEEFWTLFMFFRPVREWGFHCPERGWVPSYEFTASDDPGSIGPGCGA